MARAYYLRVRNWDRYQHYKTRKDGWRPSWIKLHLGMLDDDKFAELSTAAKWLFVGLLIKAAKTDNRIPSKPQWLSMRLFMDEQEFNKALPELLRVGLVERFEFKSPSREPSSDPLALIEEKREEENRVEDKDLLASPFKPPTLKDVA